MKYLTDVIRDQTRLLAEAAEAIDAQARDIAEHKAAIKQALDIINELSDEVEAWRFTAVCLREGIFNAQEEGKLRDMGRAIGQIIRRLRESEAGVSVHELENGNGNNRGRKAA